MEVDPFLHNISFLDMIFVIIKKISVFDIKRADFVLTPYPYFLVTITQMAHNPFFFIFTFIVPQGY